MFTDLKQAIWYIRDNPCEYLSSRSLIEFESFWQGYSSKYTHTFKDDLSFDLLDGFDEFCQRKFHVPSNRSSFGIAKFYARNDEEAFELWFSSLEEYVSLKACNEALRKYHSDRRTEQVRGDLDFLTFLDNILKRPLMYVGNKSFSSIVNLISGWLRVTKDFGLKQTNQEQLFEDFKQYLEERPFWVRFPTASNISPTPLWNKLILFRSSFQEDKALDILADYINEFIYQGKRSIEFVDFHWNNQIERLKQR